MIHSELDEYKNKKCHTLVVLNIYMYFPLFNYTELQIILVNYSTDMMSDAKNLL